jgi:hypothetical protein
VIEMTIMLLQFDNSLSIFQGAMRAVQNELNEVLWLSFEVKSDIQKSYATHTCLFRFAIVGHNSYDAQALTL